MKILICGLPGAGKTTLGRPFAELIGGVFFALSMAFVCWCVLRRDVGRCCFVLSVVEW